MKSKIVNDYIRFSAGNLYTFASGVYSAMNGNATFPDPRPSLGELNTANQQFSAAIDAARNYDRLRAEENQKARTKLEDVLQRLSNYVMVIAGNDRAIQLAAGFHVNSARKSTSNDLGEAENFSVVGQRRRSERCARLYSLPAVHLFAGLGAMSRDKTAVE